jgi:hypothetical protein
MKEYQDAHPITVTEKEAREYYESHKDKIQGLATSPAGIDVLCTKFDKKEEAERFRKRFWTLRHAGRGQTPDCTRASRSKCRSCYF